jgi:23S rRNA (uracil1939-C5)-methyltransferase
MKLRIEKSIYGGAGLARHEGKAIFIPFALPGELVEASITQDHGSYANAMLESILEPSSHRAQPPCRWFGECGGCHYQHATYLDQVEIKSLILREALERAHLEDIPEITTLHADPLGYRNRIRLHIDRATSRLCYKLRASIQNLPIDQCSIAAPALENALKTIQAAAPAWKLGQHFSEIELFTNAAQDSILLTLWTPGTPKVAAQRLESLWQEMQVHVPELSGAAIFSFEQGKRQSRLLAQCGAPSLLYATANHNYQVSLGSFFQVNRFLIDPLIEQAVAGPPGSLAWDLYAGVGLFSAALASRFAQVVAVESAPSAVRDLRQNLQGNQHRIIAGGTLDFLRHALAGKEFLPDCVIVDPPRAGLGKEVTTLLAAIRPAHITYVSCDPATLSRDLKSLLDSGYHLSSMRMVDLFPQTFHLESVSTLSFQ